jgi:hypothetical protein
MGRMGRIKFIYIKQSVKIVKMNSYVILIFNINV